MNRRTLFKTLFGTTLATAFGLEKTVAKEGIIYCDYIPIIKESFPEFFQRVNGLEMSNQQHYWYDYHHDSDDSFHRSDRQSGVSTFLATLAHYEASINNEEVWLLCDNYTHVHHMRKLISNQHTTDYRTRLKKDVKFFNYVTDSIHYAHFFKNKGAVYMNADDRFTVGKKLDDIIMLTDNNVVGWEGHKKQFQMVTN